MTSLRDYLAANAPAVPDWYKIEKFEYPIQPPKSPKHPTSFSTEELKNEYFAWYESREWDLTHPELAPHQKMWEDYRLGLHKYKEIRNLDYSVFKLTCWRYYYADQMLKARKKNMKQPFYRHPSTQALLIMLFLLIAYITVNRLEGL
ncbi:hypothetical protein [Acinetobacter pittii]|uniref:hypothetical protein n=1 Tax=Acinetobacter pittii TaxID=48296 RepID=UPI00355B00CA